MNNFIKLRLIAIVLCLVAIKSLSYAQKYNYVPILSSDSPSEIIKKAANVIPTHRQLLWQQKELLAFVHFGVNTFTNKEWGDGTEDENVFNPKCFDAEQWVRVLKQAGFKELILTCKHHDGFCLWPTKTTEHSVKKSSWKNGKGDVVKEVSEACHKYGISFGVYLSPWDRNSKYYGTDKYNAFFEKQLTELLSNYGKIAEVWFDGAYGEGPNGKKRIYDFINWYKIIRKLQPNAIIANMGPDARWVGNEAGQGRMTEWSVLPNGNMDQNAIAANSQHDVLYKPLGDLCDQDLGGRSIIVKAKGLVWYPAETNTSIRPGWFYHPDEDIKVKSGEELMNRYLTSVGMNGTFLLNMPPSPDGVINENDVRSLMLFKKLRDETFRVNIAKGAIVRCSNGKNASAILDGNINTYFTTLKNDTTTTIEMTLPVVKKINLLSIQENITVGQRVESFKFDYLSDDGKWVTLTSGTTIGYKRLLQFKDVTVRKVRLCITSSRLNPTISEFGLYEMPNI
jgi:alpha-L-fucosidase